MNIYELLEDMDKLTKSLKENAAQLHDEKERGKIEAFVPKYDMYTYLIRMQITMATTAMMDTLD